MKDLTYLTYKVFAAFIVSLLAGALRFDPVYAQYVGGGPVSGEVLGEFTNSGIPTPLLIGALVVITLASIIFFLYKKHFSQ